MPQSIMLGHYQYARYVSRISGYLPPIPATVLDERKPSGSNNHRNQSPFMKGKSFFDEGDARAHPYSWIDLFLRDELHVVGLGLDYSELGLWWLLDYKARIAFADGFDTGRTVYHDIMKPGHGITSDGRNRLLTALGVEVREYPTDDFGKGYDDAIEAISDALGA